LPTRLRRPHPRLLLGACALLAGSLVAVGGCGGGDDTETKASETTANSSGGGAGSDGEGCPAIGEDKQKAARPNVHDLGKPFTVDVNTSPPGAVELSVTSVDFPETVQRELGGERGKVKPEHGDRFVAVVYTLANKSDDEVEAANIANERFAIRVGETDSYFLRGDEAQGRCGPISANYAATEKLTSPEKPVAPGKSYSTAAVYPVPENEDDLSWSNPATGDAVAIPPSNE
jgi:hypothetical protein